MGNVTMELLRAEKGERLGPVSSIQNPVTKEDRAQDKRLRRWVACFIVGLITGCYTPNAPNTAATQIMITMEMGIHIT